MNVNSFMEQARLQNLPSYAKLFVALFTTLMLCVCLWAMLILYVQQGMIEAGTLPDYLKQETSTEVQRDNQKSEQRSSVEQFEHNVKLGHTHINGQTLLFFAMGLVFLFTSIKPKVKKLVLWTFGGSVLVHAIGLTGQNYHWFFDDILALSGVSILVTISFMAFMVFADLAKKRQA